MCVHIIMLVVNFVCSFHSWLLQFESQIIPNTSRIIPHTGEECSCLFESFYGLSEVKGLRKSRGGLILQSYQTVSMRCCHLYIKQTYSISALLGPLDGMCCNGFAIYLIRCPVVSRAL